MRAESQQTPVVSLHSEKDVNKQQSGLVWSIDQHLAFNNMVEKRPDLAKRIVDSRRVLLNADNHPAEMVDRHRRHLDVWGLLPEFKAEKTPLDRG